MEFPDAVEADGLFLPRLIARKTGRASRLCVDGIYVYILPKFFLCIFAIMTLPGNESLLIILSYTERSSQERKSIKTACTAFLSFARLQPQFSLSYAFKNSVTSVSIFSVPPAVLLSRFKTRIGSCTLMRSRNHPSPLSLSVFILMPS